MFTNIQKKKGFIRLSMILRTSGTTRIVRIHTTITKHLMKFALQHNNRLQVLQFWLTQKKTVPVWDPEKPSAFIQNHRMDYKLVAEKYDLNLETAKNLFVNFRTLPSVLLMRKFCYEADPIEFFIDFNI